MKETDIVKYLNEKYPGMSKRHLDFLLEYMKTGKKYESYLNTCGDSKVTPGSAAVLANHILKKYDISTFDFLSLVGHNQFTIKEALDKLQETDPDKYLNHIEKLLRLDTKQVDVSIKNLPVLEIVFEDKDGKL